MCLESHATNFRYYVEISSAMCYNKMLYRAPAVAGRGAENRAVRGGLSRQAGGHMYLKALEIHFTPLIGAKNPVFSRDSLHFEDAGIS